MLYVGPRPRGAGMHCSCCGSSSWRPNGWRFPAACWTISAGTALPGLLPPPQFLRVSGSRGLCVFFPPGSGFSLPPHLASPANPFPRRRRPWASRARPPPSRSARRFRLAPCRGCAATAHDAASRGLHPLAPPPRCPHLFPAFAFTPLSSFLLLECMESVVYELKY